MMRPKPTTLAAGPKKASAQSPDGRPTSGVPLVLKKTEMANAKQPRRAFPPKVAAHVGAAHQPTKGRPR